MDQQRGRSPSGAHQTPNGRQSHSPVPQNYQENHGPNGSGLGLNSSQLDIHNQQQLANNSYNVNQGLPVYNNYMPQQQDQQQYAQNMNYAQNQDYNQSFKQEMNQSFGQQNQPTQSFSQDLLNPNMPPNFGEADFSLYPSSAGSGEQYDPNYFGNNDASQASPNQSINPADLMSEMSSPPHAQTPPSMLRMDSQQLHSAQHSPAMNTQQYQRSPSHSRHASLGPESAAFPQAHMHQDWGMMQSQFQGHRRTPSEYSDVSSVAPSPNLINHDTFDGLDSHSPLMNAQDQGIYEQPMLGIGNFSLSDNIQNQGISPGHSPSVSPRLGPQQMPNFSQQNFMLGMNENFAQSNQNMYQNQGQEGFPQMSQMPHMPQMQHNNSSGEMGQAQQMIPPEINVEFAPASRQNSFEPPKPFLDQDALTPPDRGRRRRAVSDPFNSGSQITRAASPGLSPGNGSDPSLQFSSPGRSLSPLDRSSASSPSARGRRQSTSSLPNREYILGLADPEYQAPSGTSESGNTKRVQKHPATFQCTLCPKRFTRAYNLRSHLRTHTDERPFVCTVCGKAFARQHDRKRHEGLHSGEKKFVCKGDLKQGGQWGCGRRFARADALGRHFRSEAGRVCIKPLLDEEATERQRVWHEQQMQNMAHNMQQPPMAVDAHGFPLDASGQYTLPAALLAQYPALATLSWAELPAGDAAIDEDISGRSSFDASGSEYYDEGDEAGYVSGPGTGFGQGQMGGEGYGVDYSSDYGGR